MNEQNQPKTQSVSSMLGMEETNKSSVPINLHYKFDGEEYNIVREIIEDYTIRYSEREDVYKLTAGYLDKMQVKSELYDELIDFVLDDIYKES